MMILNFTQTRVTRGGADPKLFKLALKISGADRVAGPETATYVASMPQARTGNDGSDKKTESWAKEAKI